MQEARVEQVSALGHAEVDDTIWDCANILAAADGDGEYGMIILNQPINRVDAFLNAWQASCFRICADGGANRLYDCIEPSRREDFLPHMIKGDLDSIRMDVREYYQSRGVCIKYNGSEYSTDLMKCITEVEALEAVLEATLPLLLIGGLSGRVDQTVHTMSLMQKMRTKRPRIYVLNGESLAWVLSRGTHQIRIDHKTMGQTCGILPVGVASSLVTTRGLKWDFEWDTSFEGDISTSNHLLPEVPAVVIKTSKPVLWCVEVKEGLPVPTFTPSKSQEGRQHEKAVRSFMASACVSE